MALLFKKVQVVRLQDKKRSTLVYLTYSDKLIEGSPKNSLFTIVTAPLVQEGFQQAPGD